MIFQAAPDDPDSGLTNRIVSENGLVQIGTYRVLYGWRVRAGMTADKWGVRLDWCGGGNWKDVRVLYSLCAAILSSREETADCFDGLPECSTVKPFYNDPAFVGMLSELLNGVDGIPDFAIKVPDADLQSLSQEFAEESV